MAIKPALILAARMGGYYQLVIVVAGLLTLTANAAYFHQLLSIYPLSDYPGFFVSSVVLLFAVQLLLFSVLNLLVPARWLLWLLLPVTAVFGYYSDHFATIFDADMMRNLAETDVAEAADIVTVRLLLRIVVLGLLPAIFLFWQYRKPEKWWYERWQALKIIPAALLLVVVAIAPLTDQYASFMRQHKTVRYWINPVYPLYSGVLYLYKNLLPERAFVLERVADDATVAEVQSERETPELVIMVVGETARADHFSLNGYERPTNPQLAAIDHLISFTDIASCGTSTAISVPCMFSFLPQDDFDVERAARRENVLDVLHKAGVNVLWRDNNSSSKRVADRLEYQSYKKQSVNPVCDPECRDIGMLSNLDEYISHHDGDIFIVLHQMGSHGPAYYKRYPAGFEVFKPACQSEELQNCTDEEIINAYDNTLLYTDYFLSETIRFLQQYENSHEVTMIYMSDHGESLGEHGMYLHGMPYRLAPDSQKKVPLIVWTGASSDVDYEASVLKRAEQNSHDALAASLLTLFEVDTQLRQSLPQSLLVLHDD